MDIERQKRNFWKTCCLAFSMTCTFANCCTAALEKDTICSARSRLKLLDRRQKAAAVIDNHCGRFASNKKQRRHHRGNTSSLCIQTLDDKRVPQSTVGYVTAPSVNFMPKCIGNTDLVYLKKSQTRVSFVLPNEGENPLNLAIFGESRVLNSFHKLI